MKSKYIDIPATIQVIGGIYQDPNILDMEDKYHFYIEDFPEEFHKVIFGAIYNLHQLGAKEINIQTIDNYLEQRPKKYAIYKANKGEEYLERLEQITELPAFDYYYNRVKKMTLLRMYDKVGMDLKWLYDVDNVIDLKKKQKQEEWLDNHSLAEIADAIDLKISTIRLKYVENNTEDFSQCGDGLFELIEDLAKTPEFGVPLYGKYINTITRGARLKKFYLRSASTGLGKALPNYARIPTPNGWRKVGEIKVGDYLFGDDGKPTKVLATFPQEKEKEVWKIIFEDGREVECCGEHLWEYNYLNNNIVSDTQTLYKNFKEDRDNFKIKINKAVQYPQKEFGANPYIIGLAFGKKVIPEEYLFGSIEQRKELLKGIINISGKRNENGEITISASSSEYLLQELKELIRSLGLVAFSNYDKESLRYIITINEDKEYLNIVDIIKTNRKASMTCFTVDNDSHLFLTENFIVTHNTRTMIADACYIAVDKIYNVEKGCWETNGVTEPTLYISTEQETAEIQTMMLAFVSGVNEEHIITGRYLEGEKERVLEAASILQQSPIYIKTLPDFSLQDIENAIKYSIREWGVRYVAFDYIHSSMKILSEIGSKSGVKGLREDNILFMISVRLKDLCNQYNIFILSSTQLNAGYTTADVYDQNLLRGAKAIADKIDVGVLMVKATEEDREALSDIIRLQGCEPPTIKMSVYKNRRGRWKDILIWCKADLGTCRVDPLFITDYNYELLSIEDTKVTKVKQEEISFEN